MTRKGDGSDHVSRVLGDVLKLNMCSGGSGFGIAIATNGLVGKWKNIPAGEVWAGLPVKQIKKSSERNDA